MNEVIESIYQSRRVQDEWGNSFSPFPFSIRREAGMALYRLVRSVPAKNTLEIGMAYGLSTLFIGQALRDNGEGHHTAIDPVQTGVWNSIGRSNLRRAQLVEQVTVHEAPSHEVLPRLLSEGSRFDMIFVDGMHTLEYVFLDAFYADKLLNPGGHLLFDDVWMVPVRKAVSHLLHSGRYVMAPEYSGSPVPWSVRLLSHCGGLWESLHRRIPAVPWPSGGCCWTALRKVSEDVLTWSYGVQGKRAPYGVGTEPPVPSLGPSSLLVAVPDHHSAWLGDERALFQPRTGLYYGLDSGVGERVWSLLQRPRGVSEIRDLLVEEYEIEPGSCERDLRVLFGELLAAGLVERREAEG